MPRMEGKHHCASPLLFASYISNFEQLEKERAEYHRVSFLLVRWRPLLHKRESLFCTSLCFIFFQSLNTSSIFASIKSNMDSSAVTSVSQIGRWGNLPLAINTQTTVATSLLCLHNTTAINTVAHTASPHCGSSRRRNTNWNSFVAQITSGTLQLPICPQGGTRHH